MKSAWKILCTNPLTCNQVDDPERYLTSTALIYTPAIIRTIDPFEQNGPLPPDTVTAPATCEIAEVGLVGFHIAVKTFWAPQWIWPTFEHIDNVPGNTAEGEPEPLQYSFFNPECGSITLDMCLEQQPGITPPSFVDNMLLTCCPNQQNIVNSRPDPGNNGDLIPIFPAQLIPIQVGRLDPIGTTAIKSP